MRKEIRVIAAPMEVRADGNVRKIVGYALRYNTTYDIGGFREKILPGALTNALKTSDVRALFNHNPDRILGRVSAGTLFLADDEVGLRYEIIPDMEDPDAQSVMRKIQRGDITQSSFAFKVARDEWDDSVEPALRTITEIDTLYDVSPVTYPASPTTSVGVRSAEEVYQAHREAIARAGDEPDGNEDMARACLSLCRAQLEWAEKALV